MSNGYIESGMCLFSQRWLFGMPVRTHERAHTHLYLHLHTFVPTQIPTCIHKHRYFHIHCHTYTLTSHMYKSYSDNVRQCLIINMQELWKVDPDVKLLSYKTCLCLIFRNSATLFSRMAESFHIHMALLAPGIIQLLNVFSRLSCEMPLLKQFLNTN